MSFRLYIASVRSPTSSGVNTARGMSLERRLMQYVQSYVHLFVSRIFSNDTHLPSGV